jgi:NTE family protein
MRAGDRGEAADRRLIRPGAVRKPTGRPAAPPTVPPATAGRHIDILTYVNISICAAAAALALLIAPPPATRASGRDDYDRAVAWRAWIESDSRPKVGVALGGGGARGMAHIGVIRALQQAGIPVEAVAGTSIGSFIGALYATGAHIDRIEELALQTKWSNLIELKMSRVGFFSTRRLERFINFHLNFLQRDILRLPAHRDAEDVLGSTLTDLEFDDLKIPFACTATDLHSGAVVIFDSGSVATAVRASCSIPGLFEPLPYEDRLLVDGGVVLNLPVSLCHQLGAGTVIAIDVESDTPASIQGLIEILTQMIRIQGRALTARERSDADWIVSPAVGRIKTTELAESGDAIREGEIAGQAAVNAIKDRLLGRIGGAHPDLPRDHADSLRVVLASLQNGRANSVTGPNGARLVAALKTAHALGLYREVRVLAKNLPGDHRDTETRRLALFAALKLGEREAAETESKRLVTEAIPADRAWELAAAALDARLDEIAARLREQAERAAQSQN